MARVEIIPAILPKDFAEIEEKVQAVIGSAKIVQIDVCDGQFVPNATWPYRKHDDSFDKIVREEEGLPGWEDLNFEIDLMANRPEELVEQWVSAGASRIIIHAEAKGDVAKALDMLSGKVEVGLAFNMETDIDGYLATLRQSGWMPDFVQLMGIDAIGFQGQPFDDKVLDKIRDVRMAYPELPISVDGGVSLETAPELIAAGADRLVVGSAIFNNDNVVESIQKFKSL